MKRILVMDTDIGLLEVMETILSHRGFNVLACPPQADTKPLVLLHQPALIIMGFFMGSLNGGELCALLKADEATKKIPVIVLTTNEKVFRPLSIYNCELFHEKPVDFFTLIYHMDTLIEACDIEVTLEFNVGPLF